MMSLSNELQTRLAQVAIQDFTGRYASHACVAVILRGTGLENLEVGYIRRAIAEQDRWSGHVGFPGGRAEAEDASDLATALREVEEEIGIVLHAEEFLGRLDDLRARNRQGWLDFYIRPFVFLLSREVTPALDPVEVADFFWVPLAELSHPSRETQVVLKEEASPEVRYPAIRVKGDPPLWGLTLMMTQDLLARLRVP